MSTIGEGRQFRAIFMPVPHSYLPPPPWLQPAESVACDWMLDKILRRHLSCVNADGDCMSAALLHTEALRLEDQPDNTFEDIQKGALCEIAALTGLQEGIEEAASDADVPHTSVSNLPVRHSEVDASAARASLSLSSARRKARRLREARTPARKPRPCFDLAEVNVRLCDFVAAKQEVALELPAFSAPQRRQVEPAPTTLHSSCLPLQAILASSAFTLDR